MFNKNTAIVSPRLPQWHLQAPAPVGQREVLPKYVFNNILLNQEKNVKANLLPAPAIILGNFIPLEHLIQQPPATLLEPGHQ